MPDNDQTEGLSEQPAADWWQASNDLWYPPETHPAAEHTPQPPAPGPPQPPVAAPGWQQPTQPGFTSHPGPQPGYGPGQQVWTPPQPQRKGTNPLVIILAVVGAIFILGLGGCAVAGVMFARASDEVFAEFDGGFDGAFDDGFDMLSCQSILAEANGIENIDDRLDIVDEAIQGCGTVSNFEEAMLDHPELLEPGQTARELLEDRCAVGDIVLTTTRICTEIEEN